MDVNAPPCDCASLKNESKKREVTGEGRTEETIGAIRSPELRDNGYRLPIKPAGRLMTTLVAG